MLKQQPDDRPLLLVIATGMRVYREYLLRSISTRFRVHLFHVAEPLWEKEYLTGWTVVPSTVDGPGMAREALRLGKRFDGVLCWDEGRILAASYVAEALGLRNGDPAVVWRLRDKAQTRAALAAVGVPQPLSIPVKTLSEALAAADQVGYPAVLKPRGLGASLGVVRVETPAQLREMFTFTRDTKAPDPVVYASDHPVLVEQCVTGEEVSVDSVVQNGQVTPLFVARKVVGYPPYAEEIGHYVDADDPLLTDFLFTSTLQDTHTALGFTDGWTHTEFMLTATGPQLIEVNGRLGGDMIPYLGMLATGIDAGVTAAEAACGLPVATHPTRNRVAGIRFFYVDEDDTTIEAIAFDTAILPATVDQATPVAQPGAVVSPPPKGTVWGRIAYATVLGDSIDECARALDTGAAALLAAPGLILAGFGVFHPAPLEVDTAQWWTTLHVLLLPVFPLLAAAQWILLTGAPPALRWTGRAAAFGFSAFYGGLDAVAGIAAGTVTHTQHEVGPVTFAVFNIGDMLGYIGAACFLVANVLIVAAIAPRARWRVLPGAVLLLAASVSFIDSHIFWPRGVFTMVAVAAGMFLLSVHVSPSPRMSLRQTSPQ